MAEPISAKKVLLVEGKDEKNFFEELLKRIGVRDVQIEVVGGKDQFREKFPALRRRTGFNEVDAIALIRDADKNPKGAFSSIRNILKKENLSPPSKMNEFGNGAPKIGVFIMPGAGAEGMLEDLCLKTVQNNPAILCVDAFIDCCKSNLGYPLKNLAKSRAQVYLAAMPQIVKDVGVGAKKAYWDFDSIELSDLKRFLSNLKD